MSRDARTDQALVLPHPPLRTQPRLMRALLSTPEAALDELAQIGPACALGAGPLRMAVVVSPDLIRELLLQSNDHFRYDVPLSPFPTIVGKASMLASDGPEHHRRRSAVAGSLSRRSLSCWVPMIVERTDAAIDALLTSLQASSVVDRDRGPVVDLYPVGRRLVLDIVVRALFGTRLIDRLDEIDALEVTAQEYAGSPLWRQRSPLPGGVRARANKARRAFDMLIDEAITEFRASAAGPEHGGTAVDVLDQLVLSGDLTDEEIRDQVKSLIGAGFDTTASSLAWMLWEATMSPGLWSRLGDEADERLAAADDVDDAALAGLTLADATVRETLRLHPGSGIGVRTAAVDVSIGGYAIKANTIIAWSPYVAGRDPSIWDDPLRFDPRRFSSPGSESESTALPAAQQIRGRLNHAAWLPFGRGPRMCVGFALAQMELTLIAARLAQRVDLSPTAAVMPPARGLVVSLPVGGAPMHVRARNSLLNRRLAG